MRVLPVLAAVTPTTLAVVLVVALGGPVATRDEAAAAPRSAISSVDLDLSRLVTDHVAVIARRDEGYRVPTATEADEMGSAVNALAAGELRKATRLAGRHEYDVVSLTDTRTGAAHRALVERRQADGTLARGWGLYVLRVENAARLHVQAPHPLFDIGTPGIALQQFDRSRAASLAIAGAHRYANADGSSDVAHAPVSVFESSHRALTRGDDLVLQIHGFAAANHPAEMGEVVVSDGTSAGTAVIDAVAAAASADGFSVCRYDGIRCKGLGATTNVQGASTRAAGAGFIHLEIVREVRDDPTRRTSLVESIATAIR